METIKEVVESILKEYPITRDDDFLLCIRVFLRLGYAHALPEGKIQIDLKNIEFAPAFETITRCFPEYAEVMTKEGYKKIKDIKKGDWVLTHKGNLKKVYGKIINNYDRNLLEIKSCGNYKPLKVTPEHPFLVARLKYKKNKDIKRNINPKHPKRKYWIGYHNSIDGFEIEWVEAKDLKKGDILIRPIFDYTKDREVIKLPNYKYCKKRILKVDERLMRILGYYLAEGFVTYPINKARNFQIRFTFGKNNKELEYAQQLCRDLNDIGFKASLRWREYGWYVNFSSKQFKDLLLEFGRGARNKKIPQWVLNLPKEKLKYLFDAYINGDGHVMKDGHLSSTSISPELSLSIKLISEKLGYKAGIYEKEPANNLKLGIIGRHKAYTVRINNNQKRVGDKHWRIDNLDFAKIDSIKEIKFKGIVYNLEVEKDKSYVTEIGAVHNCRRDIQYNEKRYQASPKVQEKRIMNEIRQHSKYSFKNMSPNTYPSNLW